MSNIRTRLTRLEKQHSQPGGASIWDWFSGIAQLDDLTPAAKEMVASSQEELAAPYVDKIEEEIQRLLAEDAECPEPPCKRATHPTRTASDTVAD